MNKSLLLKALKMTYNMPTVTDSTTDCVFCDAKTGIAAHSSAPSEHRFRVYDHEGQSIAVCHTLKDAQTWPEHYSGFKIVERLAAPAPTGESLPVEGVPEEMKPSPREHFSNEREYSDELVYVRGWNACRATIVKAAPTGASK